MKLQFSPLDLYSQFPQEVVYLDQNGYDGDRRFATQDAGLVKGQVYLATYIEVGNSSSTLYLQGHSVGFNSVMFTDKASYEATMDQAMATEQGDEGLPVVL